MTPRALVRAVAAQTATEIRLTLKRGESLLVTLVIPAALLIFFGAVPLLPHSDRRIDALLAGTLALAVISTGMVSLSIATAYERYYGVLKRLGLTPLPRVGLIAAKMLAVVVLEVAQCLVLVAIAAVLFGWRPHGAGGLALVLLLLGTAAFSGLGLLMAGALRAEGTLATANGLFIVLLLFGGVYIPLNHLPSLLTFISHALPSAALAQALRSALLGTAVPTWAIAILLVWSIAAPALATRTFRWE